jgi:hypothetical protein
LHQIIDEKPVCIMIMTFVMCAMTVLISTGNCSKKYSLVKNIDASLWHSINAAQSLFGDRFTRYTGIHPADRFEMKS